MSSNMSSNISSNISSSKSIDSNSIVLTLHSEPPAILPTSEALPLAKISQPPSPASSNAASTPARPSGGSAGS